MADKLKKLINSPLLNRAELARRMFPNNKASDRNLDNKLSGKQGRRLTERDKERLIVILEDFCKEVKGYIEDYRKETGNK